MIFISNEQIIFIPHANHVYLIAYTHTRLNVANLARSPKTSRVGRVENLKESQKLRWNDADCRHLLASCGC